MADRPYDIVLLGATGFTGTLVAEYLARAARQEPFRWAIAGRNPGKLDEVRRIAADIDPSARLPDALVADTDDAASLARLAESARVLITTVGPYLRYGDGVLKACVDAGTHYVDLTGEPEFVDRSRAQWHETARSRGLRIVHCCGFDCIPADLGVLFTLDTLRERMGDSAFRAADIAVRGFVSGSFGFSGGTWNSAIEQFSRARQYLENRPRGGNSGSVGRVRSLPMRLYRERRLGQWACPLPTIDPQVVLQSARQRGDYGHAFAYGHFMLFEHLAPVLAGAAGVGAVFALSQFRPTADLLRKAWRPGDGPSAEKRAGSWFSLRFVAEAGQHEVVCEVSGGDPGYDETAKMLAESALCLALDPDLPPHTGVATPAAAMGHALVHRLQRAGIAFDVVR